MKYLLFFVVLLHNIDGITINQFYLDTSRFSKQRFKERYAEKLEILLRSGTTFNHKINVISAMNKTNYKMGFYRGLRQYRKYYKKNGGGVTVNAV